MSSSSGSGVFTSFSLSLDGFAERGFVSDGAGSGSKPEGRVAGRSTNGIRLKITLSSGRTFAANGREKIHANVAAFLWGFESQV